MSILNTLLNAPRQTKQLIIMSGDLVIMAFALHIAMLLRLGHANFEIPLQSQAIIYGVSLFFLGFSGVYRTILRAFDDRLMKTALATLIGIVVVFLLLIKTNVLLHIPRTVPFTYSFLLLSWLWISRTMLKYALQKRVSSHHRKRVLIYGAGRAGQQLLASLRDQSHTKVVGFLDDDPSLAGGVIAGVPVYQGQQAAQVIAQRSIHEVLLAMPSTSRQNRKLILDQLKNLHVKVQSLPSVHQLIDGKVTVSDVREVEIADLLGRDAVPANQTLLQQNVLNKVVMVTGAGGSIGSELCRQIVQLQPKQLIIFEQCEFALYNIEQELKALSTIPIVTILGSVLKEERVRVVMRKYGVHTVYHAAAYKHVPLVENNPFEGMINNSIGTYRCAQAAMLAKVETFVLISTDKAVRPTNVMGASKRLAELACQALALQNNHHTTFCMVRFGNVLGSSGSVVPLFRKQIATGGPLTVTHPDITRYFMTIPEAAQLVIQAGAMAKGGDVFVLNMGEPVKILDLAKKMILLSGLTITDAQHQGDISIEFTGLRAGEKLYEELLIGGDNIQQTAHPLIMQSFEQHYSVHETEQLMLDVVNAAKTSNLEMLLLLLEQYVEGYQRSTEIAQFAQQSYERSTSYPSDAVLTPSI